MRPKDIVDGISKPHQGKCARLRRRCCRRSGMRLPSATSALAIPCGEAWVRVRVRVKVTVTVTVRFRVRIGLGSGSG